MSTLRFLHTSPVHIPSFNTVLQDVLASGHIDAAFASELTIQHMDDESLLTEARQTGITPALKARLKATLDEAASGGADFVLCTCSSIGGAAEEMGQQTTVPVLRVDRAMAERAIAQGTRIVVAATLQSTLAPTRDLLLSVAQDAVKEVELIDVVCESAWQAFEAGDQQGYVTEVATKLREVVAADDNIDVIVLAQASMAKAQALCEDLPVPILSSPRLGVEKALRTMATA